MKGKQSENLENIITIECNESDDEDNDKGPCENQIIEPYNVTANPEYETYGCVSSEKTQIMFQGDRNLADSIRRDSKGKEYNIVFSKDTVRKASELYFKNLNNNNATLEHEEKTDGVSVIESWIVEDVQKDKTAFKELVAEISKKGKVDETDLRKRLNEDVEIANSWITKILY